MGQLNTNQDRYDNILMFVFKYFYFYIYTMIYSILQVYISRYLNKNIKLCKKDEMKWNHKSNSNLKQLQNVYKIQKCWKMLKLSRTQPSKN